MNEGWVKLHRSVCESAAFSDAEVFRIWIYILCNAAHKEHDILYHGKIVHLEKGQFVTGRKILAQKTGITEYKAYRTLGLLEKLGNVHITSNSKFSVVTVVNWDKYQGETDFSNNISTTDRQQTNSRPTADQQQINTTEECKECKECKESVEDARVCEGDFIPFPTPPTLSEIRNFCYERDSIVDPARFYNYYCRAGWDKCGDWKIKIEEWENNEFSVADKERVRKLEEYRAFENTAEKSKVMIDISEFDEAIPGG